MMLFFDNRQEAVSLCDGLEPMLEEAVAIALRSQGLTKPCEVSLSFVTPEEMRALNREYRGIDSTTDVLSFPTHFGLDLPVLPLGDIVIDPVRATKQAEEIGHSPEEEYLYLTIHSVMHLLGYDHMTEPEKKKMRAAEEKALSEVKEHGKETGDRL